MAATVYVSLNCDFVEVALDFQMLLQNGLLMPVYCQLFIPLETQCHSVSVCSQCTTYILNIQLAHRKNTLPNMCTWSLLEWVLRNLLISIQCVTVMVMSICNTAFAYTQWQRQKLKVRLYSHTGITVSAMLYLCDYHHFRHMSWSNY